MKGKRTKVPALPKAYRDAFVPAPSTSRDPEAVTAWLATARLVTGMAVVATLSWLRWSNPWGNAVFALVVGACGTLVVATPGRAFTSWFVPRGRPRAAFRAMRVLALEGERRAAAVSMGVLAAAVHPRGAPAVAEDVAFLEQQLAEAEPRGSEGVLACALLRALRGDHETARALFGLIRASAPRIFSRFARDTALCWLLADHLRQGQREQAAALLRASQPPRWRRWLTPRSRALRELERRVAAPYAPASPAPPAALDPLVRALVAHKIWLTDAIRWEPREREAALLRAAEAWDAVPAEFEAVVTSATSDLALSTMNAGLRLNHLTGRHATLDRAHEQVTDQLSATIAEQLEALRRRTSDSRPRSEIEEWLEWAAVRHQIARAHRLGGDAMRRSAFGDVHRDVTHYAAWLYNKRRQFLLAHAIFRWLLAEARFAGDEEAIRLCWNNSNIRPD